MSAECCPVYHQPKMNFNGTIMLPCGRDDSFGKCGEAERLAIERAAELDAIKTALGCQGMSLDDVLKVVGVMQDAAVQETIEREKGL